MWTMKVEGGEELAATLRGLSTRLSRQILVQALTNAGEPIRADIVRGTPRHPEAPHLADSMRIGPVRKRPGSDDVEVAIGPPRGMFYDWFLEFGTSKMSARPIYRPPFDRGVPPALGSLGRELWRELVGRGLKAFPGTSTSVTTGGRFL